MTDRRRVGRLVPVVVALTAWPLSCSPLGLFSFLCFEPQAEPVPTPSGACADSRRSCNKEERCVRHGRLRIAPATIQVSSSVAPPSQSLPGIARHFTVVEGLLCGGEPLGEDGFDSLAALGIKTIISVDGAAPDVDRARTRGMRYVHLPIGYDGIDRACQIELAKAVRDLPSPVFVHCHHGKHRGPAAAALAAFSLGRLSRAEASNVLHRAGTSKSYAGLYSAVDNAKVIDSHTLDEASVDFPEVARVSNVAATMAEVGRAFAHLEQLRAAGWTPPEDHPDITIAGEAGRIAALLRAVGKVDSIAKKPSEFKGFLAETATLAASLSAESSNNDARTLDAQLQSLRTSCKTCHVRYRD